MTSFSDAEREHQGLFKAVSGYFSAPARAPGQYNQSSPKTYAFCLPVQHADENLFADIRLAAIQHFRIHGIKWHRGVGSGFPTTNLRSSQVCCVNFLFPFIDKPESLAELLKPTFPTLKRMLPIQDGNYVGFEWIGAEDYLRENTRGRKRTRGANFTSADAVVYFERNDGMKQIVLIEWKYTETYTSESIVISESGTNRVEIYRHLFDGDFPLDKHLLPNLEALFFEPFYQLMRQQCLANEMERAHEIGADIVTALHIAPQANLAFQRVTSPALKDLGDSVTSVWKSLVRQPDRFQSVHTEALFGSFPIAQHENLREWWTYVTERYVALTCRLK